jgi:hypothetical protein
MNVHLPDIDRKEGDVSWRRVSFVVGIGCQGTILPLLLYGLVFLRFQRSSGMGVALGGGGAGLGKRDCLLLLGGGGDMMDGNRQNKRGMRVCRRIPCAAGEK